MLSTLLQCCIVTVKQIKLNVVVVVVVVDASGNQNCTPGYTTHLSPLAITITTTNFALFVSVTDCYLFRNSTSLI